MLQMTGTRLAPGGRHKKSKQQISRSLALVKTIRLLQMGPKMRSGRVIRTHPLQIHQQEHYQQQEMLCLLKKMPRLLQKPLPLMLRRTQLMVLCHQISP
jgi:hypothetical protein